MATRKTQNDSATIEQTTVEQETEQTPVTTAQETPTELESLLAQKAALDAAIKAAKASAPVQTKLERVIEKQRQMSGGYIYESLANQVIARIQAGQDRETAFSEVMNFWAEKTTEEIARRLDK